MCNMCKMWERDLRVARRLDVVRDIHLPMDLGAVEHRQHLG